MRFVLGPGLAGGVSLAGACLAGAGHAAETPGLPAEPGLWPGGLWLRWTNDALGFPTSQSVSDDHRTNAMAAGWAGERWRLFIDHSILTDKNPSDSPPRWGPEIPDPFAESRVDQRRIDELTLGGGGVVVERPQPGGALGNRFGNWFGNWRCSAGLGVRLSGDLGGRAMQDRTHGLIGDPQGELPYERSAPTAAGLLWATTRGWWDLSSDQGWLLVIDGSGLLSSQPEVAASLNLRLVRHGPAGDLWIGGRTELRGGETMSRTAASTARHERGLWLEAGLAAGGVSLSVSRNPTTDAAEGTITVQSDPDRPATGTGALAEIAVPMAVSTAHGRGIELRLLEQRLGWWSGRVAPTVVYRTATLDSPLVDDLALGWQELALGLRLAAFPPRPGWQIVPRAGLDVGLVDAWAENTGRREVAQDERFRTFAATATAGCDLAASWDGLRLSIGGEAGWRQPLRSRTISYAPLTAAGAYAGPPGDIRLIEPGWQMSLRVGAWLGW